MPAEVRAQVSSSENNRRKSFLSVVATPDEAGRREFPAGPFSRRTLRRGPVGDAWL